MEIWRDILGYEGYYQISNHGRIKSLSRKMFNGFGRFISKEIILKLSLDHRGYLYTVLTKDGVSPSKRPSRSLKSPGAESNVSE